MDDQNTDEMNGKRPFEERVFARFDAVDARLSSVDARFDAVDAHLISVDGRFDAVNRRFDVVDSSISNLDSRLQKLEIRAYDTKPIWEQALKEIVETRRELSRRLDRSEAVTYEPALISETLKIGLIRSNAIQPNNSSRRYPLQ